ncbi:PanC Panthothenate synthetase [Acidimicrobiia bacterium]
MQVCSTKAEFRGFLDNVRALGRTVGLVPTMGALHDGHLSLLRAAADECDVVALTIFVNPLQFGVGEDLSAYPRPLERDLELAEAAGADVVFTPTNDEMYPVPVVTTVHVDGLTASMEGAARPTHFDGVTTVVAKLFNIAGTCRAYFGEKDFQQLAVVTRMAFDLDQPVTVVPCPIIRESDGLAMSSRNVYLNHADREAATVLHRALRAGAAMISAGETDPVLVAQHIASVIEAEPLATPGYAEVVDPASLETPVALVSGMTVRLLATALFGSTRLLDNLEVPVP